MLRRYASQAAAPATAAAIAVAAVETAVTRSVQEGAAISARLPLSLRGFLFVFGGRYLFECAIKFLLGAVGTGFARDLDKALGLLWIIGRRLRFARHRNIIPQAAALR